MQRNNWWIYLLVVLVTGAAGVLFMGIRTYKDAPPKPDYVSSSGEEVFTRASTERGQLVFQKYALMEYGSMFGDGAARGPDFTAGGAVLLCRWSDTSVLLHDDAPELAQGCCARACIRGSGSYRRAVTGV